MSTASSIEWTDATWNPVVGCTRVSAGCDHCYAVTMTHRLEAMGQPKYAGLTVVNPRGDRHFNGTVRCDESALEIPLRWKKPRRIFVNSMSDLFHRDVPFEFVDQVFAVMAICPQHTFQVLTKRPERMAAYLADYQQRQDLAGVGIVAPKCVTARMADTWEPRLALPLPNVWLGTSCEDQAAADERIPHLLRCPAAVRFLSCEPLLGPIDLTNIGEYDGRCVSALARHPVVDDEYGGHGVDWVIVGGESGSNARPCSVNWVNWISTQCQAARVPLFVKQLGGRPGFTCTPTGEFAPLALRDRKGADPDEWPPHMRTRRQWPNAVGGGS